MSEQKKETDIQELQNLSNQHDINSQNKWGETPVMTAAKNNPELA